MIMRNESDVGDVDHVTVNSKINEGFTFNVFKNIEEELRRSNLHVFPLNRIILAISNMMTIRNKDQGSY